MTPLEATVEIVKATLVGSQVAHSELIRDTKIRKEFLAGIDELYKKFEELEKDKKPIGHQA